MVIHVGDRLPPESLQIQQATQVRLGLGEQPGASGEPTVTILPLSRRGTIRRGMPYRFDRVEIHVWSPCLVAAFSPGGGW
jgi:hypothetical protein